MNDIGKDAKEVRAKYQLICPVCGKPAVRRENCPAGPAYLHLTKHGTLRHFVEAEKPAAGKKRKTGETPQSTHRAASSTVRGAAKGA